MADDKQIYDEVIVEVVRRELSNAKRMLTALVIVCVLLLASLAANAIMIYEFISTEIVTEEFYDTYEIENEGDGNNFVAGNQYNDNATHNEGG